MLNLSVDVIVPCLCLPLLPCQTLKFLLPAVPDLPIRTETLLTVLCLCLTVPLVFRLPPLMWSTYA